MNRNSIIGFIIIGAIMVAYTLWMTPSQEELAKQQRIQDSIRMEQRIQRIQDSIRNSQAETAVKELEQPNEPYEETVLEASQDYQQLQSKYAVFANAAIGNESFYIIENDVIELEISNKGGYIKNVRLKQYETYDSLPLILFNSETTLLVCHFLPTEKPSIPKISFSSPLIPLPNIWLYRVTIY